jgi:hypothetical protein
LRKAVLLSIVMLTAAVIVGQENTDAAMIAKIRAEGLERSHVLEIFDHLVNVIGPRLTASPAYKTAVDWSRDKLVSMGFDNVHVEPWEFGRGWQLDKLSVEMIEPRFQPLIGYAKGWSPATAGRVVAAPLWLGNPRVDLKTYEGMEAWLKPLNDIGATISTLGKIGATDHLSFINVGLPGFQAVQDYNNYDVRTHHTNVDTYERVNAEALKQASVVVATVLYNAAMRDAKVPRAPAK